MPLKIIRNDITKVSVDAIVNTANPNPLCGSGTDYAIYQAAGMEQLLEERKSIGTIPRGEVAVTKGYNLNAKYIIHTVGPSWEGGTQGELEILRSCYEKSLAMAKELACESIAFPLISTGVYGFPKDKALHTAINVFSEFLITNDMQIILVVFDKNSYQLSEKVMGEIDSYIDAHYVEQQKEREYSPTSSIHGDEAEELDEIERRRFSFHEKNSDISETQNNFVSEAQCMTTKAMKASMTIGETFQEKLFQLIAESGMENKSIWKASNLDRKHFSKIQCEPNYHPRKKTVLALCIGLKLDLEQAKDLLARADWAFSPSSKMDLIVQKWIEDKKYDICELNEALFEYTNETL